MCEAQNRHGPYNHYDQSTMIGLLWSVQLWGREKRTEHTHTQCTNWTACDCFIRFQILCKSTKSLSVRKMLSTLLGCKIQAKPILMCCLAILPLHAKAKNLSSPPYTRTGDLYLAIYTRLNLRVIFTVRIGASWPWRVLVNQIVWCSKTRLNVESDIWVCDIWLLTSSVAVHCRVTILWNDDISPCFTM